MPLPRTIARFNRRITNPFLGLLADRLPPLATIVHRGRHSGREYRTPIMAFPARDEVVIALTYGREVDWVRNVLAAGGASLVYRGRELSLTYPQLVKTARPMASLPAPVRLILHRLRVEDYLLLSYHRHVAEPEPGITPGRWHPEG